MIDKFAVWLLLLGLGAPVFGWNPIEQRPEGPLRWPLTGPVTWNGDAGPLGLLDNASATQLVGDGFAVWNAVPTAALSFATGTRIVDGTGRAVDVDASNYAEIIALDNGQNPVIFDNEQEIFALIGKPSSVIGFAGALRSGPAGIEKGYVVLQGGWLNGVETRPPNCNGRCDPEMSADQFLNIVVHEVGHFAGLGHSSVNHELSALGACPGPTVEQWETMSPLAHFRMATLQYDDEVGISSLYPAAGFGSGFARIAGRLIDRDGSNGFDGANVVLRPDTLDCAALYDLAQATQSGVDPTRAGGSGGFVFEGLAPATPYTIFVTSIQDGGGYPIGGASPPSLGGPEEFYNGPSEDFFDPPDDPLQVVVVVTGATGSEVGGIEIRINNADGPGSLAGNGPAALRAGRSADGTVLLSWGEACNASLVTGQDYAVYEGTLESLRGTTDHQPIVCGTNRATGLAVAAGGGNRFWLVAPLIADREGDLGTGSGGRSRTPAATCAVAAAAACP